MVHVFFISVERGGEGWMELTKTRLSSRHDKNNEKYITYIIESTKTSKAASSSSARTFYTYNTVSGEAVGICDYDVLVDFVSYISFGLGS